MIGMIEIVQCTQDTGLWLALKLSFEPGFLFAVANTFSLFCSSDISFCQKRRIRSIHGTTCRKPRYQENDGLGSKTWKCEKRVRVGWEKSYWLTGSCFEGQRLVSTSLWAFRFYWETYDLLCWLDCWIVPILGFIGKLIIYHVWLFSAADLCSKRFRGGASCDHDTSSEAFQSLVLIGKLIICCANDNVLLFSAQLQSRDPFQKDF